MNFKDYLLLSLSFLFVIRIQNRKPEICPVRWESSFVPILNTWHVPLLTTIHKKMLAFTYFYAHSYISFNSVGRECVFTYVY